MNSWTVVKDGAEMQSVIGYTREKEEGLSLANPLSFIAERIAKDSLSY